MGVVIYLLLMDLKGIIYLIFMFSITFILSVSLININDNLSENIPLPKNLNNGESFSVDLPRVPGENIYLNEKKGCFYLDTEYPADSYIYSFMSTSENIHLKFIYRGIINKDINLDITAKPFVDEDEDNYPDVAKLGKEDSERFINWFLNIALYQTQSMSENWLEWERDCSGLIRYATRESLKTHDEKWYKNTGIDPELWEEKTGINLRNFEDVKKYNYPYIPVFGSYNFFDENGNTVYFADAYNLLRSNVKYISRNIRDARPGDLLFFQHPAPLTFHSMIYTGDGLVYHTGPVDDTNPGMIKVWTLDYYTSLMPYQWLPIDNNEYFLGIFRFKFLS